MYDVIVVWMEQVGLFEAALHAAARVITPVQLQLPWLPRHFGEALLWDCRLVVLLTLVSLSSLKTRLSVLSLVCSTLPL